MKIRPFNQTSEDYTALVHIINIIWGEPFVTVNNLKDGDADYEAPMIHRRFVAEVNNQMVGYGAFAHNPKFYDPQRFWLRLDVLPDFQRQGIGSQLYDYMLEQLQTKFDANELHMRTTTSRPHSLQFLKKRGFEEGTREPQSRLDLTAFDWQSFAGLAEKITDEGIEIRVLSDLLAEDGDALFKVYELHQAVVNDVPEPADHTRVTFESWQEGYSTANPYYIPEANFMALHNGKYVGLASLWGLLSENKLYTGVTGVLLDYRRKGLATALKLQTIAFAQAQDKQAIMTSNNSENPMLQINRTLGFQIYDTTIKLVKKLL